MPYQREHVLLTFFGEAWTQGEQWQFGLRLDQPDLPLDAALTAIGNAYAAFHTSGNTKISPNVKYLGLKAAQIGVDGKYVPGTAPKINSAGTGAVGAAVVTALPQATLAITLTTPLVRGKGSVGRFFTPAVGMTVQATGKIASADATQMLTAATTFINAINAQAPGGVAVFGQTGAGTVNEVTGLRVGRVIDTQRRRREGLAEEYVLGPLVP